GAKAAVARIAGTAAVAMLLFATAGTVNAQQAAITINKDFPGGNVLVEGIEGNTVNIAPDLGTSPPWFYWYFEATVQTPGRVNFVLPEPNAAGIISRQGPAVSTDGGETWTWLGGDQA